MLTIRRRVLEVFNSSASILPLLPRLHIIFQGRKAVGVSVHSSHGPVLVVLQVLFPPRGPLLIVRLKCIRADGPCERGLCWRVGGPASLALSLDSCQHPMPPAVEQPWGRFLPLASITAPFLRRSLREAHGGVGCSVNAVLEMK